MKQQLFSEIGLLTCALFWGASGVLTQIVLGEMSPMALIFFRFAISGILGLLVTLRGAQPLNIGDIFCFIDAIAYALYIIYNSRLPKQLNVKILSTVQYTYVSIWSLFYLFFFEHVPLNISLNGLFAIIILGVLCTFLAFLIQVAAQRHTSAERTGRIMTLIPIFTVIFMDLVMKKIAFTRPL